MKKTKGSKVVSKKVDADSLPYEARVKIGAVTFKSTGSTISEAISNLDTQKAKGRAILMVSRGTVTKERILMPIIAYRLFQSVGFTREVALKNASLLFNGI